MGHMLTVRQQLPQSYISGTTSYVAGIQVTTQSSTAVSSTSVAATPTSSSPRYSGTGPATVLVNTVPVPTLNCSISGYLIQGANLHGVDLALGDSSLIETLATGGRRVNSVGYNVLDDTLWGMYIDAVTTTLVDFMLPRALPVSDGGFCAAVTDLESGLIDYRLAALARELAGLSRGLSRRIPQFVSLAKHLSSADVVIPDASHWGLYL